MSETPRPGILRFSLGFTAFQALLCALMAGAFIYLAVQYAFHFHDMSLGRSGRYAWLDSLAATNDGKTGVVIFIGFVLMFVWLAWIAGWRFLTGRTAAELSGRGLSLHPSYRRKGEIPFEDVLSANVGPEPYSSWLTPTKDLCIRFAGRRAVRIRAMTTEGGEEALLAFAEELNAQRAFGGEIASR